jgi:hypothetical protein
MNKLRSEDSTNQNDISACTVHTTDWPVQDTQQLLVVIHLIKISQNLQLTVINKITFPYKNNQLTVHIITHVKSICYTVLVCKTNFFLHYVFKLDYLTLIQIKPTVTVRFCIHQ